MSRGRRILVVGSGGREHALAWRLGRDHETAEVFVAPGNDGMRAQHRCVNVDETDAAGLLELCRRERIDLVVVGPERPLALGVADDLAAHDVAVYGPGREGARLEASKWYAKERMREAGVPTARAAAFADPEAARAALADFGPPWVVKVDGLAAGKGVCVTADVAEAHEFLTGCSAGRFGGGSRVVLEEHLAGEEASVMAVCDGHDALLLTPARDYKRAFDLDLGPNTGGMGAASPAAVIDPAFERDVLERIVRPILDVMAARGAPYRGTLYVGLMVTASGLRVIEFNCRFGDPETQVIMPLTSGSFGGLLASAAAGSLDAAGVSRGAGAAVAVAVVAADYPERVGQGGTVTGVEAIVTDERFVFHAGTKAREGRWDIVGGRALYVCARADTATAARESVYDGLGRLRGTGFRYRQDIAARAAGALARDGGSGGG